MTPSEYRILRTGKVCDYFPEPTAQPTDSTEIPEPGQITFDDEVVARFSDDFNRLLRHRKGLQGLSKARSFQRWWDENRTAYVTRPVVDNYRKTGLSLGEFLDDLHLHFVASQARAQNSSRVGRLVRQVTSSRVVLPVVLSLAFVAHKALTFLASLLILGPGVQMVNSYTQPVITPLSQTAAQKGSQDLAVPASKIQAWLSNRGKIKEVRHELHETTDRLRKIEFRGLSAEQTMQKWEDFEKTYFDLFLKYNQTLPQHLRDGRGYFRDWMVFTQVALAANIATFDVQYWTHRKAGRLREAQAAESRIAGALAAWKLYEFMYPEFGGPNMKGHGDLKNMYRSFVHSMRFDVYIDQFAAKMAEVLKEMDAQFLIQDGVAEGLR